MIVSSADSILGVATISVYLQSGEFYDLNLFGQVLPVFKKCFPEEAAKECLTFLA